MGIEPSATSELLPQAVTRYRRISRTSGMPLLIVSFALLSPLQADGQPNAGNPSFSSKMDQNLSTHDFGLVFVGAHYALNLSVFNLGSELDTASLSLQDISTIGDAPPFAIAAGPIVGLTPGAGAELQVVVEALTPAELAANFVLSFTHDGLPDEPPQLLTINVFAEAVLGGDADADLDVDGDDFLAWQRNLGLASGATPGQGDANRDGAVTAADLTVWQTYFGLDVASSATAIPEPASWALAAFGILIINGVPRKRRLPPFRYESPWLPPSRSITIRNVQRVAKRLSISRREASSLKSSNT